VKIEIRVLGEAMEEIELRVYPPAQCVEFLEVMARKHGTLVGDQMIQAIDLYQAAHLDEYLEERERR
jgi:hypothetical protein